MCVASSHSNFGCGIVCFAPNGARCHAILHQLYPSSPSCSVLTPMHASWAGASLRRLACSPRACRLQRLLCSGGDLRMKYRLRSSVP